MSDTDPKTVFVQKKTSLTFDNYFYFILFFIISYSVSKNSVVHWCFERCLGFSVLCLTINTP